MTPSKGRPFVFIELDTGCFVPISHKTNTDGYLRKTWKRDGKAETEMFHRFIARAHANLEAIPDGYEIDHVCGTRCCCNPAHLALVPRDQHLERTNRERYDRRKTAAQLFWRWTRCTGSELARQFDVTASAACRWIREWRAQEAGQK
jgi:hypothetical protein